MPSETTISAIGALVLVRLLVAGEKGESASKVQKDLEPLLAHRWTGTPLAGALNGAVEELKAAGLVSFLLGESRKAAPKIVLTPAGRQRGLDVLGVAQLGPKTKWPALRKTYLPALALGLPASSEARFKALSSDPVIKAVLLKRYYNLPTAEVPKLEDAIGALAWNLIGFEGEARKFTLKNVKTAVLNRALGDGRAANVKKAATLLVAQRLGARRDGPKELRDAIVRDWVDRNIGPAEPLPGASRPEQPAPAPPLSLSELAERVKAAARDCPTGRYGDNKVFIAHVWKVLQSGPEFAEMGLDRFKELLAAANNARLLDLGRADLVQAMDQDDVRSSEVRYLNATFHFIRI